MDKPLACRVRELAREKEISLTACIALLIQEGLRSITAKIQPLHKFSPPVVTGTKPPHINVADRDSLYQVFDQDERDRY